MAVVSLVVMELGSEWPGHVGDAANLVAFSQDGEKLLRRTHEKLDALRRSQHDVRVAVLACNEQMDGEGPCYRAQVAHALLGAVSGTSFGRLVLSASGRASLRLRQELLSLAGMLSEQLRGTSCNRLAEVSGGAACTSGARRAPRPVLRRGGPACSALPRRSLSVCGGRLPRAP
jgi:hypothetical protein